MGRWVRYQVGGQKAASVCGYIDFSLFRQHPGIFFGRSHFTERVLTGEGGTIPAALSRRRHAVPAGGHVPPGAGRTRRRLPLGQTRGTANRQLPPQASARARSIVRTTLVSRPFDFRTLSSEVQLSDIVSFLGSVTATKVVRFSRGCVA